MEWYVEVNFILLWTWRTFKDKQGLSSRWVGQGDPVEILISVLPFAITAPSISTGGPWDDSPSSIWYATIMCYSWNPYYHKWRCSVGESKFKQWSRVWALLLGKILRREGCILSRRRCGGVLSYAPISKDRGQCVSNNSQEWQKTGPSKHSQWIVNKKPLIIDQVTEK